MSGWLSAAKLPPPPALRLSAYQPAFCDNGIQMYTLEVLLLSRLSRCGKGAGNCHIKYHKQKTRDKQWL